MSKRGLTPHNSPPAKRLHTIHPSPQQKSISIVDALSDELILSILSHLSWVDLCVTQLINKNWARLALDNQLWKKHYILTFGKPRLRGTRGPPVRSDGRQVKSLPSRARAEDSAYKDWKWMFRVSSNWRKGRCSVEEFPYPFRLDTSQSSSTFETFKHHLLLTGTLILMASSRPSYGPIVYVTDSTESCSIVCRPKDAILCHITSLVNDQSIPRVDQSRILLFLSTGELLCHQFQCNPLSSTLLFRTSLSRTRLSPVTQAVYHHPLLVTLSQDFKLSIYDVRSNTARLRQTLSSFTSFPPVSLVLSAPSPSIYKLVLAYTIPVYPHHWTAGATELLISRATMMIESAPDSVRQNFSSALPPSPESQTLIVLSARTTRAIDIPFGWVDEQQLRIMREQWSRKVIRVADIQSDGKWVILAPGDQLTGLDVRLFSPEPASSLSCPTPMSETDDPYSQMNPATVPSLNSPTSLQLYRLVFPKKNSISSSPPRLSFVRTLHGQTGTVIALSLSDGRCVSLSLNGSVWVWDLEAGTGAEVAAANLDSAVDLGPTAEFIRGSVSFDERRLIIAQKDNLVVRRFDI